MVRIRPREAGLAGILAALAAFGQIGTASAQTYSVVGQSSTKTAATGRRPIAERIKAANRPIRIKAEADLAPDEGLIRDLSAVDAATRDWTPEPPVVEFAEVDAVEIASAEHADPSVGSEQDRVDPAPSEPAVVPPPVEGAIAANPTTAEGDDAVAEAAALEGTMADETSPTAVDPAAPAVPPVASRPRNAPPPRRAPTRVTPERREALLGRLRAALAEMPRPFGLIPMPAPAPTQHRPRPAMQRLPAPVAVRPVPTSVEASGETAGSEPRAEVSAEAVAEGQITVDGEAHDAEAALTAADAPASSGDVCDMAGAADVPSDATLATDATLEDAEVPATDVETVAAVPVTETVADDEATSNDIPGIAAAIVPTAPEGSGSDAAVAAAGRTGPSTAATPSAPHRAMPRPTPTRARAPQSIVQRQRPFERLQATIESLPRPLGILPAPRPAVRSQIPQGRGGAPVARGVPRVPSGEPRALATVTPTQPVPGPAPTDPDVEAVASAVPGDDTGAADGPDAPASAGEAETPATLATTPPDAPCIEVTVEGPEGRVTRGERVTLRLTVRNTGTVAARAVAPMFHFGAGIEPLASAGRSGRLTDEGSVVFEALPELAPGGTVEVDVVAVCEAVGAVPFQAVVWCGEGEAAEQVPVDGRLIVGPGPVATAPDGATRRR